MATYSKGPDGKLIEVTQQTVTTTHDLQNLLDTKAQLLSQVKRLDELIAAAKAQGIITQ